MESLLSMENVVDDDDITERRYGEIDKSLFFFHWDVCCENELKIYCKLISRSEIFLLYLFFLRMIRSHKDVFLQNEIKIKFY